MISRFFTSFRMTKWRSLSKYILIIIISITVLSCKSIDLPTIEQSQQSIDKNMPQVEKTEALIQTYNKILPTGNDIIVNMKLDALNKLLSALANSRYDDVLIGFPPTRPLIEENKSVLGISYKNYLNVDTGFVQMNIKSLGFRSMIRNSLDATIEIEGKGRLSISGKYTGIPASASPEVELYMNESIWFDMTPTDTASILIKAQYKKITLKTKTYIKLLQWSFPWSYDVPLAVTDLIKPFVLPLALKTDVMLPLPSSSQAGTEKVEYAPYLFDFNKTSVTTHNNRIVFKSDIDLIPKKKK